MSQDERTEVRWTYTPANLFETSYQTAIEDGDLLIADGTVTLTLKQPAPAPDRSLVERVESQIQDILNSMRVLNHCDYELYGPTIAQFRADGSTQRCDFQRVRRVVSKRRASWHVDVIQRGEDGNIIQDTKAERIEEQTQFVELAKKHSASDLLLPRLLQSYGNAIKDPANELVHLYEIRDRLAKIQDRLEITKTVWNRVGYLANKPPIKQGRHRGNQIANLRDATSAELQEARKHSQALIRAYMEYLECLEREPK